MKSKMLIGFVIFLLLATIWLFNYLNNQEIVEKSTPEVICGILCIKNESNKWISTKDKNFLFNSKEECVSACRINITNAK